MRARARCGHDTPPSRFGTSRRVAQRLWFLTTAVPLCLIPRTLGRGQMIKGPSCGGVAAAPRWRAAAKVPRSS
ncbi:hypothetical protein SAMN05216188_115143 [Lentzea xinjiangensis]|uniref:Uncharacterized protein n=1 Tax=Lentzea xinjiangensis TaxID=402600 RepID=A0A1H9RYU9_9PSEU|nr:hypothetical protein SAMN05216188_115143 [Lentzea xinjiangensis]